MNTTDTCWYDPSVISEMNRFHDENIDNHEIKGHYNALVELLNLCEKGTRLMDIGCGTGSTSLYCQDFEYEGSDFPHIIGGSAMRNYPQYHYRAIDIIDGEIQFLRKYDLLLMNAVLDVCEYPLNVLRRILTHAGRYVIIHRQEVTKGTGKRTVMPSYGGRTFHSIVNRKEFMALINEMGFDLIHETSPGFANWENGGSSFLLLNREYKSSDKKKYESHPLRQLRNRIQQTEPRKIIIGAGDVKRDISWVCTNEEELDVEARSDWEFLFGDTKANYILGEHLFEHLRFPDVAAKNIFDFLKPGGSCLLAVPDGYFPDPEYIDHVRPGGIGAGASDHQWLWNYRTFTKLFEDAGFKVTCQEYFNENGVFHEFPWAPVEGFIGRSRWQDERNTETEIKYTSLIIRCEKPC